MGLGCGKNETLKVGLKLEGFKLKLMSTNLARSWYGMLINAFLFFILTLKKKNVNGGDYAKRNGNVINKCVLD